MLAAVRKVATHRNYIDPVIAEKMAFNASASMEYLPHDLLTDREMEVFRMLTTGQSVNSIAALLALSGKTVSTHKARMFAKLNVSTIAELMRYAMQHDLLG